jgi:glycosyltransferase involved in cell wall biosynthesis
MIKPRVLYILVQYPQLSETYIRAEITAIQADFDIEIVSLTPADYPYEDFFPFKLLSTRAEIQSEIDRFRPHVLHTHWLHTQLALLADLARENGIPFTVRAHSFDTLFPSPGVPETLASAVHVLNSDLCLGILALPFSEQNLLRAGIEPRKITTVFPVVDYANFLDRRPNGGAVMSVGASLPKKKFEDFVSIAASLPELEFNLYSIGYNSAALNAVNEAHGSPVHMRRPVAPGDMPAIYKQHRWLIVTASREIGTVGWPLCIAEAQASGVGVCVPKLRADLEEYVGESGFFYDSLDEVRDIITRPYPDRMRDAGFEHARMSDIAVHKTVLTDLWELAAAPSR